PHDVGMLTSILYLHIAGGSLSLLSMLIPLVTRKGGLTHRRAGWVFVAGMTLVSITALLLAGTRWATDLTPRGREAGAFLFFVAILTATNVSSGVRVLRAKARTTSSRHPWDVGLPALLTASSIAGAAHGLNTGNHLFTAFSVIGLLAGGGNLAYWLTPPTHPMHWWFEHMSSMLGACVAATTAFAVVNANNVGLQTFSLIVWLAPAVIGVPTIAIWTRYYRRKFAPAERNVARKIVAAGL
ncbi:MAG TPA: hypothetical protein VMS40_10445, partial [Vicinamibacterales bacterium]|nr:hypothetical protein [Vicinamibacterales bacterium]